MKVSILLVVGMIVALSVALIPPSAISDPACWLPGLNASCEFSVVCWRFAAQFAKPSSLIR